VRPVYNIPVAPVTLPSGAVSDITKIILRPSPLRPNCSPRKECSNGKGSIRQLEQ
jgi:hypothetical protein